MMEGADAGAWYWAIGLIAFAFGVAVGFAMQFLFSGQQARAEALEKELNAAKEELAQYRGQVENHFRRTSELVQQMTDSYRAVYEHLATSSQQLCGDVVTTPQLDLPHRERLPGAESEGASETQSPSPPPPGAKAKIEEDDEYLGDAPYVPDMNVDAGPRPEPEEGPADKRRSQTA
jgi:uncharacterized membrane-anchored protein YhcB (DUF1043 family)